MKSKPTFKSCYKLFSIGYKQSSNYIYSESTLLRKNAITAFDYF